jgi:hypothetical protein
VIHAIIDKFGNCPGSRPEALCVSCEAERIYHDFRFAGDGLDDVPALFLAVAMNERMVAKSVAPAMQRKPPEIFCLTFIMRASRSA